MRKPWDAEFCECSRLTWSATGSLDCVTGSDNVLSAEGFAGRLLLNVIDGERSVKVYSTTTFWLAKNGARIEIVPPKPAPISRILRVPSCNRSFGIGRLVLSSIWLQDILLKMFWPYNLDMSFLPSFSAEDQIETIDPASQNICQSYASEMGELVSVGSIKVAAQELLQKDVAGFGRKSNARTCDLRTLHIDQSSFLLKLQVEILYKTLMSEEVLKTF